nr:hypothetical protein [uncultured Brevundimonas sp.]
MAKFDLSNLVRLTPKTPEKAGRAGRVQKTAQDIIVENFDKQATLFKSGSKPATPAHERKLWFRDRGDEIAFQIKMGNTPLKIMNGQQTVYGDKKDANKILSALRSALVAGEFKAEIDDMEKARAAKKQNKAA